MFGVNATSKSTKQYLRAAPRVYDNYLSGTDVRLNHLGAPNHRRTSVSIIIKSSKSEFAAHNDNNQKPRSSTYITNSGTLSGAALLCPKYFATDLNSKSAPIPWVVWAQCRP